MKIHDDDDDDNGRPRPADVLIGAVLALAMLVLSHLDGSPAPIGALLLLLIVHCLLDVFDID